MTSISQLWDAAFVPTLVDYIRIRAKSPCFNKNYAMNGNIEAAASKGAEKA